MKTAAIIAEFNPLHNGHKYLMDQARSMGAQHIIVVLGGNFTQRGDLALFSKFIRAKTALACGADLVAELPTPWTMSCAELFAEGGVFIAQSLGADTLVFGSESGDIDSLKQTNLQLNSPLLKPELRKNLDLGQTYAAARKAAFESVFKSSVDISMPNDILAIEYLSAIEKFNRVINPVCIKRFGVGHDSPEVDNVSGVASASTLRQLISNNQFDSVFRYMPPASYSVIRQAYENGEFADINRISTAIISKLRTMNTQNYSQLPDISEGLEHRIKKAVEQSCDLQSLYTNIKTKRYTLARIKRIIMSAFLDIDNTVNKQPLEYIRILGCNQNGIELIKQNMQKSPVPIALRTTNITDTKQFKLECRATDLYNLALIRPKRMNLELTSGLITDIL